MYYLMWIRIFWGAARARGAFFFSAFARDLGGVYVLAEEEGGNGEWRKGRKRGRRRRRIIF